MSNMFSRSSGSFSPPGGSNGMPHVVGSFKTPKGSTNIRNRTSNRETDQNDGRTSDSFPLTGHGGANQEMRRSLGNSSQSAPAYRELPSNHHGRVSSGFEQGYNTSGGSYEPHSNFSSNRQQPNPYSDDHWRQMNNDVDSSQRQQDIGSVQLTREFLGSSGQSEYSRTHVPQFYYNHQVLLTDTDKLQHYGNSTGVYLNNDFTTTQRTPVDQNAGMNCPPPPSSSSYHLPPSQQIHSLENNMRHVVPHERTYFQNQHHDLTAWLQQHRQQLIQQQQQQMTTNNFSQGRSANMNEFSSSGNLTEDLNKVEILKEAADDIIKAKDVIIDKQKAKILQLEMAASGGAGSGARARAGGALNSMYKSITEQNLEKKLGATEYELRELQRSLENKIQTKDELINDFDKKVKEKDRFINELEKQHLTSKSELESLQKKIASQDRYLKDLPTAEEHSTNLILIKSLREEKTKEEKSVVDLEKRLQEITTGLQSRDSLIQRLEESNKELKNKIHDLEILNEELVRKVSLRVDLEKQKQLERENNRLSTEVEKARKLLDAVNKQLQKQTINHKSELNENRERINQESMSVLAFQQQIKDNDLMIKKYKDTIKEMNSENQNLTEKNIKLEEELKDFRQLNQLEEQKLQQQLMKELNVSFHDLQSLVKICLERADGHDPNLSALLGIRDSYLPDVTESSTTSINSLKYQLSKARELRHEIDKLREVISDKFAEDMGRRLTCNPQ